MCDACNECCKLSICEFWFLTSLVLLNSKFITLITIFKSWTLLTQTTSPIFGQSCVTHTYIHSDIKMATGFECEFAEKVSKGIQAECPICLLVLREPYQATCCGKSFCKECIHRIKATNQACPTCKDKDFTLYPNKGLQQSLYDFQVYCKYKS